MNVTTLRRLHPAAIGGAAVFLVALIVSLANVQTGLHGDPRTSNPSPSPRPYHPLLGVENWALVATFAFLGIVILLIVAMVHATRRDGRLPIWGIIFLAWPLAALTDPVGNWVTFAVFDPRTPHFPLDWVWVNNAPLVEPVIAMLGGYPMYYLLVPLGLVALFRRAVQPRLGPDSWGVRHPMAATVAFAVAVAIPIDIAAQLVWVRAELFTYSEGVGPSLHWGHANFPIVFGVVDLWMIAWTAALLQRDDTGRSRVLARLARRVPLRTAGDLSSSGRQILAGSVLLLILLATPLTAYGAIRVSGITHPTYDEWPYPESNVYDPYGTQVENDKPGPYYR